MLLLIATLLMALLVITSRLGILALAAIAAIILLVRLRLLCGVSRSWRRAGRGLLGGRRRVVSRRGGRARNAHHTSPGLGTGFRLSFSICAGHFIASVFFVSSNILFATRVGIVKIVRFIRVVIAIVSLIAWTGMIFIVVVIVVVVVVLVVLVTVVVVVVGHRRHVVLVRVVLDMVRIGVLVMVKVGLHVRLLVTAVVVVGAVVVVVVVVVRWLWLRGVHVDGRELLLK